MAKQTPYKMTKLSEIRPYDRNPRIIPQAAVDAVAKSITTFGFRQPIVVDGHGVILAGHTRYRAAQQLGLTEVPVVWHTDITGIQARGYRIADNKTAEIAAWDRDALDAEVRELAEMDEDALASLGMSDWELERILHDDATDAGTAPDGACAPSTSAVQPAQVFTDAQTQPSAPSSVHVTHPDDSDASDVPEASIDPVRVTLTFPDRDSAGAFVAAYRDAVASLGGTIEP